MSRLSQYVWLISLRLGEHIFIPVSCGRFDLFDNIYP